MLRPARCTPRRSTTIPAVTFFQTGSQQAGPARRIGAWLAYGLGSENAEPARLRRAAVARAAAATSRSTRGSGAPASCRRSTRACSSAAAATRCSTCRIPTGSTRADRRRMLDALRALERAAARQACWTRRSTRASRSTRWPSGCRPRVPDADGPRPTSPITSSISTARTRASPAPTRPTACSRAAWPSAACASSSSITRAGTSTATCRPTSATMATSVDQRARRRS